MTEYRITFGLKYSRETHPQFPAAHPDGWLTILAAREEVARLIANAVLDRDWAFLYSGPFDEKWAQYHPMGELARIDASLALVDMLSTLSPRWQQPTADDAEVQQ